MESPTGFSRCIDIAESNVARAIVSRQSFRAFLDRAAAVSRPEEGAPKVLGALARLATADCAWLEGDLRIEIDGNDDQTILSVMEEMGYGYRERIFPPVKLTAPFDEFVRAVKLMPRLIAPLLVAQEKDGRLVLSAKQAARNPGAPEPIDIDEQSLRGVFGDPPKKPATKRPPKVPSKRPSARPRAARPSAQPTVARMSAVRPDARAEPTAKPADVYTKKTVARMTAVRPEEHAVPTEKPPVKKGFGRPPAARALDVDPDVFTKKTVARMTAVRPEDMAEARREDQKDIDETWGKDEDE